ncbi:MAG: tRNA 2-thiouridine(34) synthase MnmA [Leptospirales bacterium]
MLDKIMPEKVLVAMSGGVDSSVTAFLLQQKGYEVGGAHMRLRFQSEFDQKKSELNVEFVKNTTELLKIPFHLVELEDPFQKNVIEPFLEEYQSGITPNPCIYCNIKIKFGALFDKAMELGYDYLATGHYTDVQTLPNGRKAIFPVDDEVKDQAYYLYGLSQNVLSKTIFPLSGYKKSQVREIAQENDLPAATRDESQEICFVNGDYREFLKNEGLTFTKGNVLNKDGEVLATHEGKENYTIGQRRGLPIAVGHPLYVLEIKENADIIVGTKEELEHSEFIATDVKYMGLVPESIPQTGLEMLTQIRYNSPPVKATLFRGENPDQVRIKLNEQVFAVTPGQSAVFYDPDERYILGGGRIQSYNQVNR